MSAIYHCRNGYLPLQICNESLHSVRSLAILTGERAREMEKRILHFQVLFSRERNIDEIARKALQTEWEFSAIGYRIPLKKSFVLLLFQLLSSTITINLQGKWKQFICGKAHSQNIFVSRIGLEMSPQEIISR